MGYRRILVPLDGSKLSEFALQHVLEIAAPRAKIHIVSVIAENPVDEIASLANAQAYPAPIPEKQWPKIPQMDPHEKNARESYLRRVSDWLSSAGYEVTSEIVPGEVIQTIVSIARRGFEVIVLVTHGRTGASKTILGSVAEGVLPQSPCPMLIIPAQVAQSER